MRKRQPKAGADAALRRTIDQWLASEPIDKARSYLERGRRFEHTTTATLKADWIANLKDLANSPTDPGFRFASDDIEAELRLRGAELPLDEAQAEGRRPFYPQRRCHSGRQARE